MDRNFPSGPKNTRHLRQRLLLGLGAALFVSGAVLLSIGLIGYFNEGQPPALEEESVADLSLKAAIGFDGVDHMPAVPYDPPTTVAEPAPQPQVAAPLRMVIERIGVDAPVTEMGMDGDGIPYVPLNGRDIAWYNFSSRPGSGSNAVFAGHINWARAPAVFANLDDLQPGDSVRLISDDGREYTYEVFANYLVDPFDSDSLKVMEPTPTDTITLITCGGTWIPDPSERFGGNYTNRTIVQGRLVNSSLAVPAVPSAISSG